VPIGQVLSATFSEAMSSATISATTFTLTATGGASVAGTVSYADGVATFTPSASLAYGTQYTATITNGATDLAGTPLASNYVWTFTTITPAPVVVSTIPVNTATGVPVAQRGDELYSFPCGSVYGHRARHDFCPRNNWLLGRRGDVHAGSQTCI
jgi:hypothetical protein